MNKKFTKDHEWVSLDLEGEGEGEGDIATIGISTYAQAQLGDIVFVDVPEAGRKLAQGDDAAVVESVKAASDIYAPVAGEVVTGNAALDENPALVNQAPETDGWFFKMKLDNVSDLDALMDEAAYAVYVKELG